MISLLLNYYLQSVLNTVSVVGKKSDFLANLLHNARAPASVVAADGQAMFVNQSMERLVSLTKSEKVRCQWIQEQEGSCPDDAETPTLQGRCFLPKEDEEKAELYAAIRLPAYNNALVRIYTRKGDDKDMAEALMIAGKLRTMDKPESNASLDGLQPALLASWVADMIPDDAPRPSIVVNAIGKQATATAVAPLVLRRILQKIAGEMCRLAPGEKLTVDSMQRAAGSKNFGHVISVNATVPGASFGKAASSRLRAAASRIERFTDEMSRLTGYQLNAPELVTNKSSVTARLSFPDVMSKAVEIDTGADALYETFTPREEEIVELVKNGLDNVAIGEALDISPATVKQNLKNIYRKADIKNRVDLISKTRSR